VVFNTESLLVAHIGDGRAAYCNTEGYWKSIMVPFSGELANEAIFITSPFWDLDNAQNFVRSQVVEEVLSAFCLFEGR